MRPEGAHLPRGNQDGRASYQIVALYTAVFSSFPTVLAVPFEMNVTAAVRRGGILVERARRVSSNYLRGE